MINDKVIYILHNGRMRQVTQTKNAERPNFVIKNDYGDWSGFRTLAECLAQIPELEQLAASNNRPNGFYQIVER